MNSIRQEIQQEFEHLNSDEHIIELGNRAIEQSLGSAYGERSHSIIQIKSYDDTKDTIFCQEIIENNSYQLAKYNSGIRRKAAKELLVFIEQKVSPRMGRLVYVPIKKGMKYQEHRIFNKKIILFKIDFMECIKYFDLKWSLDDIMFNYKTVKLFIRNILADEYPFNGDIMRTKTGPGPSRRVSDMDVIALSFCC